MARLFGTDGARGVANSELTCELAMQIGRSAAFVLRKNLGNKKLKIFIGKDTRISSDMLESALIAGLCSVGADAIRLGVIPTPAVAFLTTKYEADAGIMISASHNPFEFNGIKIFAGDGYKISEELEKEIESLVLDAPQKIELTKPDKIGLAYDNLNAIDDYISHLKSTIDTDLTGLKVAFDCSNGASFKTAKKLFSSLGVKCTMLFDNPDGININNNCGSTHVENLANFVELELKHEGYDTDVELDGRAGLEAALNQDFDVILLDLMLPELNGIEVARRVREIKDTPIIIMTARDSVIDRVSGLDHGADDYIVKPFAIEELLARVRALLRRISIEDGNNKEHQTTVNYKDLTIEKENRVVRRGDEVINLTKREYELLLILMENINVVMSRKDLLSKVWGYDSKVETNVVDVYIRYLRNKIDRPGEKSYIQTVRGTGYVIRS